MTDDKLIALFNKYCGDAGEEASRLRQVMRASLPLSYDKLTHIRNMAERAIALVNEGGRREKAMRWVGFMQGALWAMGHYSVDQLKEHSRPDRSGP